MPPVFGPRPPSKIRLKSWAGCRAYAVVPSQIAKTETSGPSRNSSITTRSQVAACASASARSRVTTTPLPAASASSLTTYGAPELVERGLDLCRRGAGARARRRHPGGLHHVLGERLRTLQLRGGLRRAEDRDPARASRRRRRPRPAAPRARRPRGRRRAARPGRRPAAPDIGSTSCSVATAAMPGLPGAACTSVTAGSRDRARASACSRPPVPMTRVFTGRNPRSARG